MAVKYTPENVAAMNSSGQVSYCEDCDTIHAVQTLYELPPDDHAMIGRWPLRFSSAIGIRWVVTACPKHSGAVEAPEKVFYYQ